VHENFGRKILEEAEGNERGIKRRRGTEKNKTENKSFIYNPKSSSNN
jgi:hypothetical protein